MIKLENIYKSYGNTKNSVKVLENLNLTVHQGEISTVIGNSGSGKTTLLSIMGALMPPDSGNVTIEDNIVDKNLKLNKLHQEIVGFIFQEHYLLPEYNVIENLILPQLIAGKSYNESKKYSIYLLEEIKLDKLKFRNVNEVSRGEKQRIALLRGIVNNPKIILADEPTGNLDKNNCKQLLNLIVKINKSKQTTFIIATHDKSFIDISTNVYELKYGMLTKIG